MGIASKFRTAFRKPSLIVDRIVERIAPVLPLSFRRKVARTWHQPKRSLIDALLFNGVFAHLMKEFLSETDPDRREAIKDDLMAGEPGAAWADHYDAAPLRSGYIGRLTFEEACPCYGEMDRLLANAPSDTLVVQIGSSSGREMAHYAGRFPRLSFLGTDIDEVLADRARKRHQMPNLRFAVARAHTLFDNAEIAAAKNLILFSNGSLQYVHPDHLLEMFRAAAALPARVHIVLGEPWEAGGEHIGLASTWRGSFSHSHDYRRYCEAVGMVVNNVTMTEPYADRPTFHYNLVASNDRNFAPQSKKG